MPSPLETQLQKWDPGIDLFHPLVITSCTLLLIFYVFLHLIITPYHSADLNKLYL